MDTKKYFIVACLANAGLGHIFITIFNCAHYALKLNRILVIDMRKFQYFKNNNHEHFFKLFKFNFPSNLNVICNINEVNNILKEEDIYTINQIEMRKLNLKDDFDNKVIFNPGSINTTILKNNKSGNYGLELQGRLHDDVNNVLSKYFKHENKVIGVHFRHGNGEFLHDRVDSLKVKNFNEKLLAIKKEYIDTIHLIINNHNLAKPDVYLASDNFEFKQSMNQSLENSFFITKNLPNRPFQEHIKNSIDNYIDL